MTYLSVTKDEENFEEVCRDCFENITKENLFTNGGTLKTEDAVFQADTIIVAMDDGLIVGYSALRASVHELYIIQIAVKNSHKRMGIGRELLNHVKKIAFSLSVEVTADIREYNQASQALFESNGFIRDEEISSADVFFYRHNKQ